MVEQRADAHRWGSRRTLASLRGTTGACVIDRGVIAPELFSIAYDHGAKRSPPC
jgi:hypothetical protein